MEAPGMPVNPRAAYARVVPIVPGVSPGNPDPAHSGGRRSTSEVRGALLLSAVELFARKGYGGTSTKEIATAARTSEATIYRQFGSKAELFTAAVVEPFSAFLVEYQRFFGECMAQESWTDQIITERSVERLFHHLRENRDAVLAMISALGDPESAEPARQAIDQLHGFFDSLYEIGLERWRRDPIGFDVSRLRLIHRFLVGMVFSVSALDRWFVPRDPHRPTERELIEAITEFVLRGFVDHAHGAEDPPPRGRGYELLDQLSRLAAFREAGTLTESEFSAAKAILLDRG
jgi:AcrR family transcriptional regulator